MSTLKVVRAEHAEGFVILSNATVRPGGSMSARALGIHVNLLSHKDGFEVSVDLLMAQFSEGREAIAKAVRELEDLGLLDRWKRWDGSKWVHGWTAYEVPQSVTNQSQSPTPQRLGHQEAAPQVPVGSKKITSSEDQLEEDLKFSGSSATRPTTRDLAGLALVLGETDPILVAATWLALKADGARNPLAFARSLAERGELDGYLGTHIYAEDYAAEAANL